jgi:hypothetical protein
LGQSGYETIPAHTVVQARSAGLDDDNGEAVGFLPTALLSEFPTPWRALKAHSFGTALCVRRTLQGGS